METTLTSEISAIQIKLMYLHYKSIKINSSIRDITSVKFKDKESSESIEHNGVIVYDIIDVITLFENYNSLVSDVFNSKFLSKKLSNSCRELLKKVNKATVSWKHVRNKVGGHIDINSIIQFCEFNNYKGVFISDNLQTDFKGVLLIQLLESAVNMTLDKSKLFNQKLDLIGAASTDMVRFIEKLNSDWKICIDLFKELLKHLYLIGKKEKLKVIDHSQIGIIKF